MPKRGEMAPSPDFRPPCATSNAMDWQRRKPKAWPSGCTCATCRPTVGTCASSAGITDLVTAATIALPGCIHLMSAKTWRRFFSGATDSYRLRAHPLC